MSENNKGLIAYLSVCLFWGSTYLAIRIGVKDFPPSLFAAFRFIIAGSIMFMFAKFKGYEFPKSLKAIRHQSVIGLLMLLGGTGLVCHAEKTLHSSIASLIISTVPLFIALFDLVIFKRSKMSKVGIFGLIIGFVGVAVLALAGANNISFDFFGMILALGASFFWSTGSMYSSMVKKEGHIVSNIAIQMLAGGIGLLVLGGLSGEFSSLHPTSESMMALLYLVVFGSIVGYSSYIYVLQVWPASRVGTYAYVNPVVALFLGVLILNEPVNLVIIMSLIIILSGVILVQRSKIEH
ncbi:EamA family transporter [Acidaminobacter sp. JC074]|uniref:EamA family transporter n=1 Tax=Acidaminobacter sp. JC074 TaxID=2530199 RepID=UPI001F0E4B75|nr:EamA family transporter [Acidaminobacter sp. JC074]MCH4890026.1 EamA family transporter [Acidaminobacter sp. JC074]